MKIRNRNRRNRTILVHSGSFSQVSLSRAQKRGRYEKGAFVWNGCLESLDSPRSLESFKKWLGSAFFNTLRALASIRERPPGLLQDVLTVLVFWSWILLLPRLPPSSQSLRLFPWASILLYGPLGHWLGSAAHSSPITRAKTGRSAHVFTAQGAHAESIGSIPHSKQDCLHFLAFEFWGSKI